MNYVYSCRKVLNMRLFPNESTGKGWDHNVISSLSLFFFFWLCIITASLPELTAIIKILLKFCDLYLGVQVMQRNYEVLLGNSMLFSPLF